MIKMGSIKYNTIFKVTENDLEEVLAKYEESRGGFDNEDTNSEAMFFFTCKYLFGAQILTHGYGPIWIGLQNATARYSNNGKGELFPDIRTALTELLHVNSLYRVSLYYSTDAVQRLRFIAEYIEECRDSGDFLIYG